MLKILPLFALALSAAASAAQPIDGRWKTHDGKAVVEIGRCGGAVCGKVVRILSIPPNGSALDKNNSDPKLRSRPIQGLAILSGFAADGSVWKGEIYDPEGGKNYRSIVERLGPDRLKVKGCIAFFCRTLIWTRAG